jgi:hypothetical protein
MSAQAEDTTATEDKTEEVDTSTNEEALDTEVGDDLEDDTTSFDDVEDDETEEAEDSETEEEDTEPAETEEKSEEDVEQPETEESTEGSTETKEEDTASEEAKKQFNAEQAKRRIAERQAREAKQELERQNLQRYLDEAGDDELELGRRKLEVEAYGIQMEKAQLNADRLQNGIEKAVATIPLFQTGSPEIKAELVRRIEDFEAKHVQYDKAGRPVNVTADVYEYLQNEADSLQRILNSGAQTQSKAKEKAKARTDTLPSRAPKEKPKDPDMDAFDEAFNTLE